MVYFVNNLQNDLKTLNKKLCKNIIGEKIPFSIKFSYVNHPDLIHQRRENQSSGFIFSNDILNLIRDYGIFFILCFIILNLRFLFLC